MHLHNYTRTQTNTCILTPTHGVWARACDTRVTHNSSVGDGLPPNRHAGFNAEWGSSLFADTFFFFVFTLLYFCFKKGTHGKTKRYKDVKTSCPTQVSLGAKICFFKFWICCTQINTLLTTERKLTLTVN